MSKYHLINAINEADDASFLTRVKNSIMPKKSEKPKAATSKGDSETEIDTSVAGAKDSSKEDSSPDIDTSVPVYSQFVDKFRRAAKGDQRVVLRMSQTDLSKLYLKQGGGKDFISSLKDDTVKSIAKYPAHPEKIAKGAKLAADIEALPPGYSFSKLITSPNTEHDVTVLLDIPDSLMSELIAAGKSADANAAKLALTKMMNHKFYVMTLSNAKAKKIASKVDAGFNDLDATAEAIHPSIVIAYPNPRELKQIRTEWAAAARDKEEATAAEPPKSAPPEVDAIDLAKKALAATSPKDDPVHAAPAAPATAAATTAPAPGAAAPVAAPPPAPVEGDVIATFGPAWDKFVTSMGGVDKDGRLKDQKKIPTALRQQLFKMATAVGYNP